MKRALLLLLSIAVGLTTQAQTVTNVDYYQVGKQIVVTYSLDKQSDISVYCSTDGGNIYGPALKQVTGDVGRVVSPGNKSLSWDVLAEVEKLTGDNIVLKIVPGGQFICEMVYVEGGTFMMGATPEQGSDAFEDEKPAHQITVPGFYIGKYEVTQAQWKAVMGSNPSYFKGDNLPVEQVSWVDIQEFLRKLNAQTGGEYRLPSEAEWEYAARGGNKSRGYKYSGGNDIGSVAWYAGNSSNETHAVGQKSPNELGIYDMSGNVMESNQDWYGDYGSSVQTNSAGPSVGSDRAIRSGSWSSVIRGCRVSFRYAISPDTRSSKYGFRLVSN